jgi:hypothetical protein
MASIPKDAKTGFYIVIGAVVALYVASLLIPKLPGVPGV